VELHRNAPQTASGEPAPGPLEGDPGVGKTTLARQFLLAGVAAGERALYITLSAATASRSVRR
jgi:hypothetical protein